MDRTWKAWTVRLPNVQRTFWVSEEHKKGGYHIHGLLDISRPDTSSEFAESYSRRNEWLGLVEAYQKAAGFGENHLSREGWHRNKIETYKGESALKYCTKYLTKSCSDWDFFVNYNDYNIDEILKSQNENS